MKQGTNHNRLSAWAQMPAKEIFTALDTSKEGLSDEQAEKQREKYGENVVTAGKKDTVFYRLRIAFINPISVVLFVLALISFLTDVIFVSNFSRNFTTSVIILVMLLVSGIVRFVQEMTSSKVADNLLQLVHTTVQVRRNNEWQERPAEELVVGDLVRLDAGDRVPADIRLYRAVDFFVSQSVITGESGIQEKTPDAQKREPEDFRDYSNILFTGSTVTGGTCSGIVLAVGQDTVYGGLSPEADQRKNGFDRGENSIAWVLIKFMVVLLPIIFIASGLTKDNWVGAFLFALSVSVGLMPELLPMVITACLARGSYQMGQKQTIVKNVNAMEGFGSMDILCVDKTGTLTGDVVLLEYYMDVFGNESREVLDAAYLNSFFGTGVSNHLDRAILRANTMPGMEQYYAELPERHSKLDEIPFDYNRKFSSVLLRGKKKSSLLVKGNVDEVVERCSHFVYKNERHKFKEDALENVHSIVDEMLEDGMQVLAVAAKQMDGTMLTPGDENGLTLIGYLAFFDAPKQSAGEAVQKLQDLHIGIKVLTGDNEEVAANVCRRIGLSAGSAVTGAQLDNFTENELPVLIEKNCVFAELSPRQKAGIVETLQDNGHTVGFLGDGMNDLPAEIQADVGISVDNAMDALKESADVILMKKDLNVLDQGVVEGRRAFANMSKYIRITSSSNFGNIIAIVIASILLPFFPMTAVQIILLDLLYDFLCLILPWDNVDTEQTVKPREWSGVGLGRFMVFFGLISLVFDILTFVFLFFALCPYLCGGSYAGLAPRVQEYFVSVFQTGWFLESLWTQILVIHWLRTAKTPFVHSRSSTPVLLVTIFGIFLFTLITVTPLGPMLGLTAMPVIYFLFLLLIIFAYLLLVSLFKRLYMRKYHDLI